MPSSPSSPAAGLPAGRLAAAELVVLLCALLVMLAGFIFSINAVRREAVQELDRRARLADSYLHSRLQSLDALAGQFRAQYAAAALADAARAKVDPAHKVWVLAGVARAGAGAQPPGVATGLPPLTGAIRRELGAAQALEAGAGSVLAYNKDVARLSYLSANRFVYVLPGVAPARFRFSNELYKSPAWAQALPARNPAGEMIVGGLREDAAGPGRLLTLAAPVLVNRQRLGVLALELRPDVLRALVDRQGIAGDVVLVDREGRSVARDGAFRGNEAWPLPRPGGRQLRDDDGTEWSALPLADGRLYLLHRLGPVALLRAAALRSLPAGLFFVLLAVVAILSLRLRRSLATLSQQAHRDPLTRALSRRGLYEGADVLRALATRSRKPLAVVMFDIDAFKKVNELQGHERGDKVLVALLHGLQHQVRDYDVLCRWSGEEFLAVLMLETAADAIPVAERLRNVAATACLREALTLVTISAGMAMWQAGESLDAAIARADQSLMAAKAGGRDRLDVSVEVAAAVA